VKKCQELERKALTIVPNFSKDGAPAKKKKNTVAPPPEFNWRLQLLVPPPQKKNRQKSE
jgi:hypothetical protein